MEILESSNLDLEPLNLGLEISDQERETSNLGYKSYVLGLIFAIIEFNFLKHNFEKLFSYDEVKTLQSKIQNSKFYETDAIGCLGVILKHGLERL